MSETLAGAEIYSKDLIDTVFFQPYSKIGFLEEAEIAERKTASVYLRELEKIGVLKSVKEAEAYFHLNAKLLDLLGGQD